jgi:hypothetical protein
VKRAGADAGSCTFHTGTNAYCTGTNANGTERPYFAENGPEKIVTELRDLI